MKDLEIVDAKPHRRPRRIRAIISPAIDVQLEIRPNPGAPRRAGKQSITGWIAPDVGNRLRIAAAEDRRTVRDVVAEAVSALRVYQLQCANPLV